MLNFFYSLRLPEKAVPKPRSDLLRSTVRVADVTVSSGKTAKRTSRRAVSLDLNTIGMKSR
jgi:hypothetical protein